MKKETALVSAEQQGMSQLLELAVEKGLDPAGLEKLTDLSMKIADRVAVQQFSGDFAKFKQECPAITTNAKGQQGWRYAQLSHIASIIDEPLLRHGFTYSWDESEEDGRITCTCTIDHVGGHSRKSTFTCPTATKAGMSEQQKAGNAYSHARRQSLVGALGLVTCDPDNDAAETFDLINEAQVQEIEDAMAELEIDVEKFTKFLGVKSVSEITTNRMPEVNNALAAKRRARATE